MRLEPSLRPDPGHGRRADPDLPREPPRAPVGGALGLRERLGQDLLADVPAVGPGPARVGRVGEAREALLPEPPPPEQDGRNRDAELIGDLDVGGPLGCPQDDPGPHGGALLGGAGSGHDPEGVGFGFAHGQSGRGMGCHVRQRTLNRFKNQDYCASGH